ILLPHCGGDDHVPRRAQNPRDGVRAVALTRSSAELLIVVFLKSALICGPTTRGVFKVLPNMDPSRRKDVTANTIRGRDGRFWQEPAARIDFLGVTIGRGERRWPRFQIEYAYQAASTKKRHESVAPSISAADSGCCRATGGLTHHLGANVGQEEVVKRKTLGHIRLVAHLILAGVPAAWLFTSKAAAQSPEAQARSVPVFEVDP